MPPTFTDWTPDFYGDVATLFVNEEADVLSAGVPNGLKVSSFFVADSNRHQGPGKSLSWLMIFSLFLP